MENKRLFMGNKYIFFLFLVLLLFGVFIGMFFIQSSNRRKQVLVPPVQTTPSPSANAPVMLSLTPNQGDIGVKITVTGTMFYPRDNYIVFGSAYLGPFPSSDGKITFTLPDKGTGGCNRPFDRAQIHCMAILVQTTNPGSTYNVSVLTPGGESNKIPFHVTGQH